MRKRLPLIFTLLLVLYPLVSRAQHYTLSGFSNFSKEALTPVYVGQEVQGYTMFYRSDQAGKNHYNFGLDLFDHNLRKLKSITITKEGYYTNLLQTSFNGSVFGLYFYNYGTATLEIEVYDKSLNKVGSKILPKPSSADRTVAYQQLLAPYNRDNRNIFKMNLYAVPNQGFIRNGYTSGQKSFLLEMYDNDLDVKWTYQHEKKPGTYEEVIVNEVTDKYLLATIARRPSKSSKKVTFSISAFDIASGKKILDQEIKTDGTKQLVLGSFKFDEKKHDLIVTGEFYSVGDRVLSVPSQGLFLKRIGLDGKEKSSAYYTWEKDITPLLPQEAKQHLREGNVNFVHNITVGADGALHLVTEQYQVKRDGVGLALAFLGSVKPTFNGIIGNLIVYTADADLKLTKVHLFEKAPATFGLPRKIKPFGNPMTGLIIRMTEGFDYQYAQKDNNQTGFSTAFIAHQDIKKNKFDERTLVNLMYSGQAGYMADKVSLASSKATTSYVYPAKPGYVMILESQNEKKSLEMKLVKLNK